MNQLKKLSNSAVVFVGFIYGLSCFANGSSASKNADEVPKPVLIFDAKDIKTSGGVSAWTDSISKVSLSSKKSLQVRTNALGSASSVSFQQAADSLQSKSVSSSKLFSESGISYLGLVKIDNFKSPSELFGFGDCKGDKVELHLPFNGVIGMQFGKSPKAGFGATLTESVRGKFVVFGISRSATEGIIVLNGQVVGLGKNLERFKIPKSGDFSIGVGSCGNVFKGELVRIEFYTKPMKDSVLIDKTKSMMLTYGIK
ncbi:MAG: hypothetical protein ACK5P6_01925 [Pseudobdellovibrionaceae bacterium]